MSLFGLTARESRNLEQVAEDTHSLVTRCQCHDCFSKREEARAYIERQRELQRKLNERVLPTHIDCVFYDLNGDVYKEQVRVFPTEPCIKVPVSFKISGGEPYYPTVTETHYRAFFKEFVEYAGVDPVRVIYREHTTL